MRNTNSKGVTALRYFTQISPFALWLTDILQSQPLLDRRLNIGKATHPD